MKAGVMITIILMVAGLLGLVLADNTVFNPISPLTTQALRTRSAPLEVAVRRPVTPAAGMPLAADSGVLVSAIARLERQQAVLHKRLDEVNKRLAMLGNVQFEVINEPEEESLPSDREQEELVLAADPAARLTVFDNDFLAQIRHDEWAQSAENKAGNALSSNEHTADKLLNIECRATVCRALLHFDLPQARIDSLEIIPLVLEDFSEVNVVAMEDTEEVTVYFSE